MVVLTFQYFWIYILYLCFDLIFPLRNFIPSHTLAFNIDEEYPIVIKNNFNGKEAHFGASLLLVSSSKNDDNQRDETRQPSTTGWVVIGAPKANSTSPKHRNISEPGVIWRCALGSLDKLGDKSHAKRLCETVEMDPTGYYDPRDPSLPYHDRKDGGWLGGTMFVGDSDRFVTCASRWINQKFRDLYLLNGICYWLPKSHITNTSDDSNWPWLAPKLSYRLMPLVNRTRQYYIEKSHTPIVHRNSDRTFDWAFGQFGFSIHLTPNNELIAGAPGTFDWTGSIVYYRDTLGPQPQFRRYNAHAGSPAFSEVLVVRSQMLTHLLGNSEYFGYSVTSGKFFSAEISKNKTQIAAGAPRASELSGKVIVFTIKEVPNARSEGRPELLVEPLEGRDTTKGNHYGSYFGHSLLALDVNGDGYDDLLVAAPLYGTSNRYKRNAAQSVNKPGEQAEGLSERNSTVDGLTVTKMKNSGDEGCVFVYLSTGDEFSLTPQDLCGDQISGARFGMALSSLRDVNRDGFNDVAVGAPYENEGRGAVYIYHGGSEYMVRAQKLNPELVDPLIRTFGWSLSMGVDIDSNGYPDLAVGAYESNQVVVYRSLPIVHFSTILSASIPKLLSTTEEFNVTTCINYQGHGILPSVLALWVKLTLETESEGRRLVALVDPIDSGAKLWNRTTGNSDPQRLLLSYKRLLQIRSDGVDSCHNFSAIRVGSVDGPVKSIPIRQEHWLDGYNKDTTLSKPVYYEMNAKLNESSGIAFPVVNLTKSKSQFNDFNTKLPMPAGNLFGIHRLVIPVGTICEADGDPACLANLTISAVLKDQSGQIFNASHAFTLGNSDILTVEVELKNHRETANLPVTLTMQWLQPPVVRRLPSNCEYSAKNNLLLCNVRKPIKENQKTTMILELNMAGVYGGSPEDQDSLKISFQANTSSSLVQPATHTLMVPLRTEMSPHNFCHKSSKIEYFAGNSSIPIFGFTQAFEVGLDGPSSAAAVQITFEIPVGFYMLNDNGENRTFHHLISLKNPVLTYDGKIKCKPINESILYKDGFLGDVDSPNRDSIPEVEDDTLFANHDYGISKVSETTRTLLRKIRRVRRSLWMDQSEEKGHFGGILKLHCDPLAKSIVETKCLQVICTADHFTPTSKAVVEFKLKMFNKVAEQLLKLENYKDYAESAEIDRISSIWIESFGAVRTLNAKGKPFGNSGSLQFTSRLQIPPPYELPAWIIIVAVGGGLLLFTVVAIMLKKCGFFRRSKRDELIRRKIEEFERSRLISAPNSPSTSSTARIRTNSSSSSFHRNQRNNLGEGIKTVPNSYSGGSLMAMSMSSPGTSVKQKEIPGAVDLNELRRLYEYAYDDDQSHIY